MAKRVRVLVTGRVQNVGFRAFVARTAARLRLTGWVRNLSDGRVELEAEGDDQAVEALIAQVRRGPRAARIDDVLIEPRATRGDEEPSFTVR